MFQYIKGQKNVSNRQKWIVNKTFSINRIVVIEKVSDFNSGFVCSYISWFDGVLKDWIYYWLPVRSLGIGRVLIVSSDSILKNSLGLMVSCHNFRWVSNDCVLLLGLGGHRCLWGCGVLQPFGQRRLRSFLVFFHQLPYSRAYSILDYIRRLVFKYFWGFVSKPRDLA